MTERLSVVMETPGDIAIDPHILGDLKKISKGDSYQRS
jgi:hypothetical protein